MWVQEEVEEGREGSSRSRRRRVDLLGLLGVEGGLLAQVALLVGRVRVDVGLRAREDEDEKSAWARSPRRLAAVARGVQPDQEQRERETHLLLVVGQGAPRLGDELALLEDARLALEHVRVDASCPNVGRKAAREKTSQ